ncbi:MAG TPA: 2OG-Fe(II) oxygenase [Propylenella sp.]
MSYLDIPALRATPLKTEPYDYLVVPGFVGRFPEVVSDYPDVPGAGSHPLSELDIRGHFKSLLDELNGPDFRHAIEDKFGIDLQARPTMFTVRGECRASDGKIHTDSASKLITVLLYMNDAWDEDGGRLRILRSGADLNDYAEEVPPHGGTLLAFRRSEKSWHGHEPFQGRRRAVQMNWVTDKSVVAREQGRHRISTAFKKLNPFRKAS